MPTMEVLWPEVVSRSAVAAANSSALPVCEAQRMTTSRRSSVAEGCVAAAREYIPASVPFTHRACSGLKGASGGRTGTPGTPAGTPARKPTRY